jgi:hypothetical protein
VTLRCACGTFYVPVLGSASVRVLGTGYLRHGPGAMWYMLGEG